MDYDGKKVVSVQNLKDAVTRIKTEYMAAISKSGQALFEKADEIPTPETARENVLYLVKNEETGHYDIYALIEDKVEWIDDTTVDLGNYVTVDMLNDIVAGQGAAFAADKTDSNKADSEIISAYFDEHGDATPKKGDVFVVNTKVGGIDYEQSAYIYDGKDWIAMTGNVDASKVIMRGNITMAGDYTQVGNQTKTQNGTAEFETNGKSVAAILTDIFSKRLQPTITAQPSVASFSLTGAGPVEAGTTIAEAAYSAATLSKGTYKYGPKSGTGVTASSWKVERITDGGTETVSTVDGESLVAGTDNNGGSGFVIGDNGGSAVASLKYKVTATHGEGVVAEDNLGDASNPEIKIAAGTKSKETSAYTPYRNYFYGATEEKPTLDSAYIRGLNKSNKAYVAETITVNVPAGATRVCIACIAGKTGVTKVINETAMNADVTETFGKQTVSVEGANGYAAKEYNVWVFEPAKAYENPAVLKVTLG